MSELTKLQRAERDAMCGDRDAVLAVVSGLRQYRAAVETLLAKRYRDGEVDAVAMSFFQNTVEDIEFDVAIYGEE
jgi:hypothetical protein